MGPNTARKPSVFVVYFGSYVQFKCGKILTRIWTFFTQCKQSKDLANEYSGLIKISKLFYFTNATNCLAAQCDSKLVFVSWFLFLIVRGVS